MSSAQPLLIRLAHRPDVDTIAALHLASWQSAYRGLMPDAVLDTLDPRSFQMRWHDAIAVNGVTVHVAENGELLGFCAHGPSRDEEAAGVWEVYNLHVAPERRGGGVGRSLFEQAMATACSAGATALTLWVLEGNHPARRFYERQRMRLDEKRETREVTPGTRVPEVRYRLGLSH